jgi:hypothetical protein
MFDEEFCGRLEYAISASLSRSVDIDTRRCWCDGILLPDNERDYLPEQILRTREVVTKAWIDGGQRGQFLYDMRINFGDDSLDKLKAGRDLRNAFRKREPTYGSFSIEKIER